MSGAKKPKLARERKITGKGPVCVRQSILAQCENIKRMIYGEDGKPVSDSRMYVEVTKRERVDGSDSNGEPGLYLTTADGAEWLITVEKMR